MAGLSDVNLEVITSGVHWSPSLSLTLGIPIQGLSFDTWCWLAKGVPLWICKFLKISLSFHIWATFSRCEFSGLDISIDLSVGADVGIPVCDLETSHTCMWPAWGKKCSWIDPVMLSRRCLLTKGRVKKKTHTCWFRQTRAFVLSLNVIYEKRKGFNLIAVT